VRVMSSQPTA